MLAGNHNAMCGIAAQRQHNHLAASGRMAGKAKLLQLLHILQRFISQPLHLHPLNRLARLRCRHLAAKCLPNPILHAPRHLRGSLG